MAICTTCNGRKKIEGAGFMKYDCEDCNATGKQTQAAQIQKEIDEIKEKKAKQKAA